MSGAFSEWCMCCIVAADSLHAVYAIDRGSRSNVAAHYRLTMTSVEGSRDAESTGDVTSLTIICSKAYPYNLYVGVAMAKIIAAIEEIESLKNAMNTSFNIEWMALPHMTIVAPSGHRLLVASLPGTVTNIVFDAFTVSTKSGDINMVGEATEEYTKMTELVAGSCKGEMTVRRPHCRLGRFTDVGQTRKVEKHGFDKINEDDIVFCRKLELRRSVNVRMSIEDVVVET